VHTLPDRTHLNPEFLHGTVKSLKIEGQGNIDLKGVHLVIARGSDRISATGVQTAMPELPVPELPQNGGRGQSYGVDLGPLTRFAMRRRESSEILNSSPL
jgi:hypothetical protein